MFYPNVGTSSSAPTQPAMGFDAMFGGVSSSQAAGTSSEEWVAPPSSDDWAACISIDIFGMPLPSHDTQQGDGSDWDKWQ